MRIRDVGFLPEGEIQARAGADAPYVMGHDGKRYPMKKIVAAAELASSLRPGVEQQLVRLMSDHDNAVRYWGAMGLLMRGEPAVRWTCWWRWRRRIKRTPMCPWRR